MKNERGKQIIESKERKKKQKGNEEWNYKKRNDNIVERKEEIGKEVKVLIWNEDKSSKQKQEWKKTRKKKYWNLNHASIKEGKLQRNLESRKEKYVKEERERKKEEREEERK